MQTTVPKRERENKERKQSKMPSREAGGEKNGWEGNF